MRLAQLLLELVDRVLGHVEHTSRPTPKRAIWRHSSEPIEPPAPVTSTVWPGKQFASPATSSATGSRPSRSSSSIFAGPRLRLEPFVRPRQVSSVMREPAARIRASRRSADPGGLATSAVRCAVLADIHAGRRWAQHAHVLHATGPTSAAEAATMPTGCHWCEPLSARRAPEASCERPRSPAAAAMAAPEGAVLAKLPAGAAPRPEQGTARSSDAAAPDRGNAGQARISDRRARQATEHDARASWRSSGRPM